MRGPQVFTYNPARNPDLKGIEPRLLTLDQEAAIDGPFPDDAVRPAGWPAACACGTPARGTPTPTAREVVLTEFADPDATSTYFQVSNPNSEKLTEDELVGNGQALILIRSVSVGSVRSHMNEQTYSKIPSSTAISNDDLPGTSKYVPAP